MTVGTNHAFFGVTSVGVEVGFFVVAIDANSLHVFFLETGRMRVVAAYASQILFGRRSEPVLTVRMLPHPSKEDKTNPHE